MNNIVLKAVNAAWSKIQQLPGEDDRKNQERLLINGTQIDAQVKGVFNIFRLQEMVSCMKTFLTKRALSDGCICMRFEIPRSYQAVTPYVQMSQLYKRYPKQVEREGIPLRAYPVAQPNGTVEFKLRADTLQPQPTHTATFILSADESELIEWFPGELPVSYVAASLTSGGADLDRCWIRTGSLNQHKHQKRNHQPKPLKHNTPEENGALLTKGLFDCVELPELEIAGPTLEVS